MRGERPSDWRKDWLYEYFDERAAPKNRGIRTEQYKLIHYWQAPEEFELYDLKADPGEIHNLAADPAYAAIKEQLRARRRNCAPKPAIPPRGEISALPRPPIFGSGLKGGKWGLTPIPFSSSRSWNRNSDCGQSASRIVN